MAPFSTRVFLALATISLSTPTQGPTRQALQTDATDQVTPIHTAGSDQGHLYGLWGAGADYKASFHDGMTFIPYLGADYPQNQPFSWSTRSIRIGQTEVHGGAPSYRQLATRQWSGSPEQTTHFEYDLGAATEAYDLRADGLEQTFVIQRAPARSGDLVVIGAVDSQLTAPATAAAHQSLVFFDGLGNPIVSYGAAFAVDAKGRKMPMTTAYQDHAITLTLPAHELSSLVFPVTVDPLLGNVGLQTGTKVALEMDCLREDIQSSNNVWYCVTRAASATDTDLWIRRTGDRWAGPTLSVFVDITSAWSSTGPQIASVSAAARTITAFTREFANNTRRVRLHAHDFGDLAVRTSVSILPVFGNSWRPDVGGTKSQSSGTTAMLVYQSENVSTFSNLPTSRVFAVPIDLSVAGQVGVGTPVAHGFSGSDNERPRINQQSEGGSSARWIVVFQAIYRPGANDDWDVAAAVVADTALQVGPLIYADAGTSSHSLGPQVAGEDGSYSVMYAMTPNTMASAPDNTVGWDLRVRRLTLSGTTLAWGANLSSLGELGLQTLPQAPLFIPPSYTPGAIATDTDSDSHCLVTFQTNSQIWVAMTGFRGGYVSHELLTTGLFPTTGGASFDDDRDEFVLQYTTNMAPSYQVWGDVWTYAGAPSPVSTGMSCSRASLSWSGPRAQQIGAESALLRVTGAPANAIHYMIMSLAPTNVPLVMPGVAIGCRQLVASGGPDYLGILDFRIGANPTWTQSLPESLVGDTIYFQDWHTDPSGALLQSTQRLEVVIVE